MGSFSTWAEFWILRCEPERHGKTRPRASTRGDVENEVKSSRDDSFHITCTVNLQPEIYIQSELALS